MNTPIDTPIDTPPMDEYTPMYTPPMDEYTPSDTMDEYTPSDTPISSGIGGSIGGVYIPIPKPWYRTPKYIIGGLLLLGGLVGLIYFIKAKSTPPPPPPAPELPPPPVVIKSKAKVVQVGNCTYGVAGTKSAPQTDIIPYTCPLKISIDGLPGTFDIIESGSKPAGVGVADYQSKYMDADMIDVEYILEDGKPTSLVLANVENFGII